MNIEFIVIICSLAAFIALAVRAEPRLGLLFLGLLVLAAVFPDFRMGLLLPLTVAVILLIKAKQGGQK